MIFIKQWLKLKLQKTSILRLYYDLYPQKPLYIESLLQYIVLSRWWLFARMRLRMLFLLIPRGFRIQELDISQTETVQGMGHLPRVVTHNLAAEYLSTRFSRRRSEHLIYIIRAIESVPKNPTILCIGPKNEGELLLYRAHGMKQVKGIDLFTYSPWIQLMDMHHMTFADNSFDVISAGYVLRYSYDLKQCIREIIRVCKNGGLIAIGFSGYPEEANKSPGIGTDLYTIDTLLNYFKPHVKHVYWKMEDGNLDELRLPAHSHTTIFSISK